MDFFITSSAIVFIYVLFFAVHCFSRRRRILFYNNQTCLLLKYFASQGNCVPAFFACLASLILYFSDTVRAFMNECIVAMDFNVHKIQFRSFVHSLPTTSAACRNPVKHTNREKERSPLIFFFLHLSQLCPFFVYIPVQNSTVYVFSSPFLGIKRNEKKKLNKQRKYTKKKKKTSKESFAHFFAHIFIDR